MSVETALAKLKQAIQRHESMLPYKRCPITSSNYALYVQAVFELRRAEVLYSRSLTL